MIKSIKIAAAVLLLGQGAAFAGTALSQLPGIDDVKLDFPALSPKASSVWVNFRINDMGKTGFSFSDYAQNIQINGYKDFDGNARYSGRVDNDSVSGSLQRGLGDQVFTFEMGAAKLKVERYAIHYKVTGMTAGVPVDMVIRGAIRERAYAVSYKGIELTARKNEISGTVDPSSDKKFAAALASIMASLMNDEVLGAVETAGNFPNPFVQNNGTTLTYTLLQPADYARITVYDMYGKVLATLDGGTMKGENRVFWDGRDPYNGHGTVMGRKILIWQLELTLRGAQNRTLKQFTMDAVER